MAKVWRTKVWRTKVWRAWRWTSAYWRVARAVAQAAYATAHALYHALVPKGVRVGLWTWRRQSARGARVVAQRVAGAVAQCVARVAAQRVAAQRVAAQAAYATAHALYHALVPMDLRVEPWTWRQQWARVKAHAQQSADLALVQRRRTQLARIIARHPELKGIVVFLPSVAWNHPLFQRPHQMALAFASQGYLVFYWLPVWPPVDDPDHVEGFRQITPGLYLCNVPAAVLADIQRPIAIAYFYNGQWADHLSDPILIYEMIDHLDIFSQFSSSQALALHGRLMRRADIVVGTADGLAAELRRDRPDALLCPNGVDVQHFRDQAEWDDALPPDIAAIVAEGKPIIGYYGALARWFDFELVKHAARALSECNFVLIGPDYDGTLDSSGVTDLPNVSWLGPKTYRMIPRYLHAFTVATIPFLLNDAIHAVSPLKLFEYMAGRRPIVTTEMAECCKYPVVLTGKNPSDYVAQLRRAIELRHDEAYLAALAACAEENTWEARAQVLIAALENGSVRPTSRVEPDSNCAS